jgi:hypothetical protein
MLKLPLFLVNQVTPKCENSKKSQSFCSKTLTKRTNRLCWILGLLVAKGEFTGSSGNITEAAFGFFPGDIAETGGVYDALTPRIGVSGLSSCQAS